MWKIQDRLWIACAIIFDTTTADAISRAAEATADAYRAIEAAAATAAADPDAKTDAIADACPSPSNRFLKPKIFQT